MYMNGLQSLILRAIDLAGAGGYVDSGSDGPARYRGTYFPTDSNSLVGFRPALYVKL